MRCLAKGLAVTAAGALAVQPVAAQNVKTFQPASVWALDYGDDYCRLMRDFTSGSDTVGIFIERTEPGPVMRLIVVGDGVKLYRGATEIGYRLLPSGAPRTAQRNVAQTANGQQYLNLGPITLADLQPAAPGLPPVMPPPYSRDSEKQAGKAVTGIVFDKGVTAPVQIETGELGGAAEALQACADDLLTAWDLDADKHRNLRRAAMPAKPTAGWVEANTIAFTDFAKLSGGNNALRVMVNAEGKATSCHVHWPSLPAATNQKICASLVAKAEFQPALDQAGTAIPSYWTTNVFFLLPPPG